MGIGSDETAMMIYNSGESIELHVANDAVIENVLFVEDTIDFSA
jgi:hypothetical protein